MTTLELADLISKVKNLGLRREEIAFITKLSYSQIVKLLSGVNTNPTIKTVASLKNLLESHTK